MKFAIAKENFCRGGVRTLQKGKKYKVVKETRNGIIIKDEFGCEQGFNKDSDWVELVEE